MFAQHFVMFPIKDPKGKQELVNVVAFNYRDGQATPNRERNEPCSALMFSLC